MDTNRFLLTLILLVVSLSVGLCQTSYLPAPLNGVPEQMLYRDYYTVSYNKQYKVPNWVAWKLTAEHTEGGARRSGNAWHEDEEVPMPRAAATDYKGSGWTRGHMCPAGDNKWNEKAMYDSFLLTNCCPQHANLNSGTWNQIEMACRKWARKYGELHIVTGPVFFRREHKRIGRNRVAVPEAFFKVVVCLNKKHTKGIGFVCRNTDGNRKKDIYVNSIDQVERITGIDFFPSLPDSIEETVEATADIDDWK